MTPQQLPLFDPSYWSDQERRLLAAVDPVLIEVFLAGIEDGIDQLPAAMRVLVDWDLLNEQALAFARMYSGELVRGITATTRRQVQTAVAEWIESGQPMDSLTRALAPVFGERRARLIAQTESTRSYAAGNITAWQTSGLVGAKRWYTVRDERVCFPAWTMVTTREGEKPIQDVKPGDMVLTRKGYRKVIAASFREYSGPMTGIEAAGKKLVATSDHPVWHSKKGWLSIGEFQAGDSVNLANDQIANVDRVFNFAIGYSNHVPTVPVEVLGLSGVPLSILMPVFAVNLKSYIKLWEKKINGVSPHLGLLNELHAKFSNGIADNPLWHSFTLKAPVARKGAELAVAVTGEGAKLFIAIPTVDVPGRSTALLGAVPVVLPLVSPESLAASLAVKVDCIGRPASIRANGVPVSNGSRYLKHIAALGANLRHHLGGAAAVVARARTKLAPSRQLHALKRFTAFLTEKPFGDFALEQPIARARTKLVLINVSLRLRKFFSTLVTSVIKGHEQLLINMGLLYHTLLSKPITVYDIQVEDAPEFYANGILVHNCPICGPLHNTIVEIDAPWQFDPAYVKANPELAAALRGNLGVTMPPAHPGCRCYVLPVVIEAFDPAELAERRFDRVQMERMGR